MLMSDIFNWMLGKKLNASLLISINVSDSQLDSYNLNVLMFRAPVNALYSKHPSILYSDELSKKKRKKDKTAVHPVLIKNVYFPLKIYVQLLE